MARRLCFEAVPVAGRVVALGGALLCGGWGEEGDGGEGAGINTASPRRSSLSNSLSIFSFFAYISWFHLAIMAIWLLFG